MPIAKPRHLDPPDEVIITGHLIHIYDANSNGKLLLESLLWLCDHYRHVNLVATNAGRYNEPEHISTQAEFHCRAPFIEKDFELDSDI